MKPVKLGFIALPLLITTVGAQQPAINEPISAITVSARGEVKVVPDRASIQISVQTRAETAAKAAAENATKQKAVIDALRALGLGEKDISTSGYNVYPEQRYEPNREPVITGYNVTNTVSVDLKSVTKVGQVIDAALAKGANMINSLQFYASNTETARRDAIAIAIRKARGDAEAAARAAGGSLSELLQVDIGAYYPPQPRTIQMKAQASMAPDTPINAGDETISVEVSTRWRFVK